MKSRQGAQRARWRQVVFEVIFEAETPAGKFFDIALFLAIVASVIVVMLDSVSRLKQDYGLLLRALEWVFTAAFTIEYALRLASAHRPIRYAASFFGLVDLLSIAPTYASLVIPGTQSLLVIRTLRLLRVFRVLKLAQFLAEASQLGAALRNSSRKITVFVGAVMTIVVIMGALMYLIEGEESGFTSIPRGVYWAIVTMTTVGYGDIAPSTVLGQFFAAALMVAGYAIIAVPTGIVTVELGQLSRRASSTRTCPACLRHGHDQDASYCKYCASPL